MTGRVLRWPRWYTPAAPRIHAYIERWIKDLEEKYR